MFQGIDVSRHNGKIDWTKVKQAGKDFVFVRAGWTWYEGGLTVDEMFHENMQGATKAGLNVGVYVYSYDTSVKAAKIAAQELLKLISPYKLTYPVVFDMEYEAFNIGAGKGKINTDIVAAFLSEIEAAGYYSMLYCSTDFYQNYLQKERLKQYDLWVADYREPTGTTCPFKGNFGIWQYQGNTGRCAGVNGACDLNVSYRDYPKIISGMAAPSIKTISIEELREQGYTAIIL